MDPREAHEHEQLLHMIKLGNAALPELLLG